MKKSFLLLGCIVLLSCSSPTSNSKIDCPQQDALSLVKSLTPYKLKEPSGVVFHRERGTLFVVGDQGDIEELTLDGVSQNTTNIDKRDFEGITCNPESGLLYVVEENKSKIYEIDPQKLKVRRTFSINWDMNGSPRSIRIRSILKASRLLSIRRTCKADVFLSSIAAVNKMIKVRPR